MAQIVVHDVAYDVPESFTLKELRVLERYGEGHMDWGISQICALIHVAIMRAKPELGFEEIQAVVDDLPAEQLDSILNQAGQSPPAPSSDESSESSTDDSGITSEETPEARILGLTGSPDSGFSAFHRAGSGS